MKNLLTILLTLVFSITAFAAAAQTPANVVHKQDANDIKGDKVKQSLVTENIVSKVKTKTTNTTNYKN